ncbi:MAG TPA: zinc-ribbon domain-containing protein [Smithella sp.]|nr:zinc-ribbon domain-containing protein [Smithella sp.]
MQCTRCQFQNIDGVRFCNECGFEFTISCPKCNKANPPGSKFCNECGYDLRKISGIPAQTTSAPAAGELNIPPSVNKIEPKSMEAPASSNMIGQILVKKKVITEFDLGVAMERKRLEPKKYLGQILAEMGCPQSRIMKAIYYSNKRKKLGEILVEMGMITAAQLQELLQNQAHQKKLGNPQSLGSMLAYKGIIKEEDYLKALSAHFSMPLVSLIGFRVTTELQKAVGERFAWKERIVVLKNDEKEVTVAVSDPNLAFLENIEKFIPKGKFLTFCLASSSDIESCLENILTDEWHLSR